MSTDMSGIYRRNSLSELAIISVNVPENSKYRVLSTALPWEQMANIANEHRGKTRNINNGAPLDIRLHLGALVAQSMDGWTDRFTEDQIIHHAGVRILCGIEDSVKKMDHSSLNNFRQGIGEVGIMELNKVLVDSAQKHGFTCGALCSSDTTVQESPIAHPTEVGHLKNIAKKLVDMATKIKGGIAEKAKELGEKIKNIFTEIRLFTKGKKEETLEKKKKLAKKMSEEVKKLSDLVNKKISGFSEKTKKKYQAQLALLTTMQEQIKQWMETGIHPRGKIISLWHQTARAISKEKAGKSVEFGVRWFITRLMNGYIIGDHCKKIGADSDCNILEEVLPNFLHFMNGEIPKMIVYDRGGDGPRNHEIIEALGIESDCIFRKGKEKMDVDQKVFTIAKRERALSEASIATIKCAKYGFNKPRGKSEAGCLLKGHAAILGANLNKYFYDSSIKLKLMPEIA